MYTKRAPSAICQSPPRSRHIESVIAIFFAIAKGMWDDRHLATGRAENFNRITGSLKGLGLNLVVTKWLHFRNTV
jgi:hypothetical protein